MEPNTTIDRRQVYRPFLERLSPASIQALLNGDLIVPPEHDPRDQEQPPIHEAFATAAELRPGAQMALVGGIGSGKTTELLLTRKRLSRHADAVNVYVDLAEMTDINQLNQGAILVAIGRKLYLELNNEQRQSDEIKAAYRELLEPYDSDDVLESVPVRVPGLLEPRFPSTDRRVDEVLGLLTQMAVPLLARDAQVTLLIDGLDRLIEPDRFRRFAEQDLRALRHFSISIVISAPLLLWFDKSRFLFDYFDEVRHIPAALADPEHSDFLKSILVRRGAGEIMDEAEIDRISRYSGGVLRDLITLTYSAAQAAYRDDEDRVGPNHVYSAIRQLGSKYRVGLGEPQMSRIQRLNHFRIFSIEDPVARELLVNRQVLEYFKNGREYFAVHPALAEVLREPE